MIRLKRAFIWFLCVLLVLTLPSCGQKDKEESSSSSSSQASSEPPSEPEPPPEFPVVVNGTTVASRPGKVVSLSPAITEKIFDLGLEGRLAGVSSIPENEYPDYARCGTVWVPDIEMIGKLRAHLVLSETPLPDEDRDALLAMEIDVVVIPHAQSVMELWDAYIALCRMFEGEYAGKQMGDDFVSAVGGWLDLVRAEAHAQEDAPKPALYLREMPFTIATGDSLEGNMMNAIGLRNIAAELEGWNYPEELANGEGRKDFEALQVMFFDNETVSMKTHLEKSSFYWNLKATWNDWFLPIDYEIMERQSMRTFEQLLAMAEYAWPEADFPAWPPAIKYSLKEKE